MSISLDAIQHDLREQRPVSRVRCTPTSMQYKVSFAVGLGGGGGSGRVLFFLFLVVDFFDFS